jgi:hypothetical protein
MVLGWVAAASGLAGCSSEAEGPPDGAVHLFNQTNFERSVRVEVARTGTAETLLDESFTVPAGSRITSAVVMREAGDYEVTATSDGSRSARTLTFPAEDDGMKGYVRVAMDRDGVLVSRAGLS